jgi:hypothetical protein
MHRYVRLLAYGLFRLALGCVAMLAAFAAFELGYRIHSHRPVLVLDDWSAARIASLRFGEPDKYDAALGWTSQEGYQSDEYNTLGHGIRRNFDEGKARTGGILAVGDEFTGGGMNVADSETWPAHLERITGVPVANGGVTGYGADQIVLQAERLMPVLQPETLVVGLGEESISRTRLVLLGVAKPYFTLKEGQLAYHPPSLIAAYEQDHAGWRAHARGLLARSAVLDIVLSQLAPGYWYGKPDQQVLQAASNDPIGVTCALIERLKMRADAAGVRTVLLMQHARRTVAERTEAGADAEKVRDCAAVLAIAVVDQLKALRDVAAADPDALGDFYLHDDGFGQMSSEGNRHAAELVARVLGKRGT